MENNNSLLDEDQSRKEKERPSHPLAAFSIGAAMVLFFLATTFYAAFNGGMSGDEPSGSILTLAFLQIFGSIVIFGLTAFSISRLITLKSIQFFRLKNKPKLSTTLLVVGLLFSANFFLNFIIDLNHLIPFPSQLENGFVAMEEQNMILQNYFLSFNNIGELLLIFLTMAIVPALVEELFFRGLLQGSLQKYGFAPVHCILLSSVLFGLIHFQLYNFLAFVFMGAILGYGYYLSKNLWVPILGHLFNNGFIVVVTALNKWEVIEIDVEGDPPFYLSIIGMVVFVILAFLLFNQTKKEKHEWPNTDLENH